VELYFYYSMCLDAVDRNNITFTFYNCKQLLVVLHSLLAVITYQGGLGNLCPCFNAEPAFY
jgi:hypothetical protein